MVNVSELSDAEVQALRDRIRQKIRDDYADWKAQGVEIKARAKDENMKLEPKRARKNKGEVTPTALAAE